jgi:SAM-dependent methyltransferase
MATIAEQWLHGAGDDYYQRNKHDFGKNDIVMPLLEYARLAPKRALVVGCADGWQCVKLRERFGCLVSGIDPSGEAIAEASRRDIDAHVGTADTMPFDLDQFDLVVLGFCMWLVDPRLWFRVADEVDRVLAPNGFLAIHDFASARPMAWTKWAPSGASEREKVTPAFLYDFPKLWFGHPLYQYVAESVGVRGLGEKLVMIENATLLKKLDMAAFSVLGLR